MGTSVGSRLVGDQGCISHIGFGNTWNCHWSHLATSRVRDVGFPPSTPGGKVRLRRIASNTGQPAHIR